MGLLDLACTVTLCFCLAMHGPLAQHIPYSSTVKKDGSVLHTILWLKLDCLGYFTIDMSKNSSDTYTVVPLIHSYVAVAGGVVEPVYQ